MSTKQKRFILPEDEIPKYWYKHTGRHEDQTHAAVEP